MRFNQRSARPSFLAIGMVAGVLGLTVTSMAMAAETSDTKTTSAKAMHKTPDKAGTDTMGSRMAPTQNTKGSGANPAANTTPNTAGNKMSGGNGQMKPMSGSKTQNKSNMPRMAPTQNTKANGSNPKANK